MPKYKVWSTDEEREDAHERSGYNSEAAAEDAAEARYPHDDYPKSYTFNVEDERGEVRVIRVTVEPGRPVFRGKEKF